MRYGQIRKYDVANGPGIRVSVFVTGCSIKCFGCFNEEYQSKMAGEEWTKKEENLVLEYLLLKQISGLSILGGEPLEQDENLLNLLKRVKKEIKDPFKKNVWLWSGYCYEDLNSKQKEILKYVDVLVDGPFIFKKKDLNLKYCGSLNQRVIDLNKTRYQNKIVLFKD